MDDYVYNPSMSATEETQWVKKNENLLLSKLAFKDRKKKYMDTLDEDEIDPERKIKLHKWIDYRNQPISKDNMEYNRSKFAKDVNRNELEKTIDEMKFEPIEKDASNISWRGENYRSEKDAFYKNYRRPNGGKTMKKRKTMKKMKKRKTMKKRKIMKTKFKKTR